MENLKSALVDLDKVFPEDWLNIPRPLIDAVIALKTCVKIQAHNLATLSTDCAEFELKANKKFISVQEQTSEYTEKIKNIDEAVKKSVKATKSKLKTIKQELENKITDDIQIQKIGIESKNREVKEQMALISRKLEGLPKINQVQELISQMAQKSQEKALQEFKENYIIPELSILGRKLMNICS